MMCGTVTRDSRVLFGPKFLAISRRDSRVTVELTERTDACTAEAAWRYGRWSRLFGADELTSLIGALSGIGAWCPHGTADSYDRVLEAISGSRCIPLAQAIREALAKQYYATPTCVTTSDEALLIPAGTSSTVSREAVRLFVSRASDTRLLDYAPIATDASGEWRLFGDYPHSTQLQELPKPSEWPTGSVTCWEFGEDAPRLVGALTAAGALEGPADDTIWVDSCAGAVGTGRLASVEVAEGVGFVELGSSRLHLATGQQALPNLAFCDPRAEFAPDRYCSGVALDEHTARVKCFAEGAERYALASRAQTS